MVHWWSRLNGYVSINFFYFQAPPVPSKDTIPKDKDRDSKTDKAERKMKDKQQSQSQLQTTPQQLTVDQDQQVQWNGT